MHEMADHTMPGGNLNSPMDADAVGARKVAPFESEFLFEEVAPTPPSAALFDVLPPNVFIELFPSELLLLLACALSLALVVFNSERPSTAAKSSAANSASSSDVKKSSALSMLSSTS